jgi:hypothetical protein
MAGGVESAHDRSATVITALKNGICERHELPHQFECSDKISVGYLINDSVALRFELIDQMTASHPLRKFGSEFSMTGVETKRTFLVSSDATRARPVTERR